jgi:hypothetical protein
MIAKPTEGYYTKKWLSESGTYPIMVVLGFALSMSTVFMSYKLTRCPDVRVTSNIKGQTVRHWGSKSESK